MIFNFYLNIIILILYSGKNKSMLRSLKILIEDV